MNNILTYSSYVFHPLFMSFAGVCTYYAISPKYFPPLYPENRIIQLFVLTIIIPLLFYRILKKLGFSSSLMMKQVKERKIPYFIGVLLNLYITLNIFKPINEPELHYFFAAITFTSIAFFCISLANFKASLHAAAISGLTMFTIALSVHFEINMIAYIGLLFLINGLVISSRIHLKAHTTIELIVGFILGLFPQFMMTTYWI